MRKLSLLVFLILTITFFLSLPTSAAIFHEEEKISVVEYQYRSIEIKWGGENYIVRLPAGIPNIFKAKTEIYTRISPGKVMTLQAIERKIEDIGYRIWVVYNRPILLGLEVHYQPDRRVYWLYRTLYPEAVHMEVFISYLEAVQRGEIHPPELEKGELI